MEAQRILVIGFAGLIVAIGVIVLRLGGVLPLTKSGTQLLATAWLAGAALAKWIRGRHWKNQPS